jgi:competence protein ComEC
VLVDGTLAADAASADAGVRLIIDVHRIQTGAGSRQTAGRIQANVTGELAGPLMASWTRGRRIAAPVVLRRPQIFLNPGAADLTWQQLRQRSDLVGSIKSASLVDVTPGARWQEAAASVRRHVRAANARYLLPRGEQAAAIAAAILIGDRAGLSDDVERRLQAAGTYHVIAISGGNVALLAALCFWALRLVIRSPRAGSLICMSVIAAYGVVVGGEASVTRAVVAACIYLAVGLAGLRAAAVNVLSLVALVLVVADPLMVIDVGAWLSFGATLGIILWAGAIASVVKVRLLAATLAAEVMLLPVAAAVFSRVSVAGLLCNFVAIPAMAVVQIASMAVVCLAAWPGAASWPAIAADLASRILINSAQIVDVAPWLSWRVPPPSFVVVALFYGSVLSIGRVAPWARKRPWTRMVMAVAPAALSSVVLFAPMLERAQPAAGVLRITTLDVGQGDAILVQTPGHHAVLIDCGGTSGTFDIGGRIVVPAVWASGVRRLDWLTFTHPDIDHIGGALSVADDLSPREIWEGVPVPPHASRVALLARARSRAIVWRQLLAGHAFEAGGVLFEVRHPPPPEWERQRTRNDDSLVLRLRYGDADVWLTGDAGAEYERHEVATLNGEEHSAPLRILKVGHHGSLSSTSFPFLRALRPQIALVSAGRANLFGHPAPDIVARLEDAGAEVFRTDLEGAIVLETDGRAVWVRTMTGRTWRLDSMRQ